MTEDEFLTLAETRDLLKLGRNHSLDGVPGPVMIGNQRRYHRPTIAEWAREQSLGKANTAAPPIDQSIRMPPR